MGHDMAPVTRGVSDGEKNRLVLPPRLFKGDVSPGIPVHWIIGVLDKVGALFPYEMIRQGATLFP